MAIKTRCLTPGAIFHTTIKDSEVSIKVDLPFSIPLNKSEAEQLEALLHNQVEIVLSRYFK